MKNNNNDNNNNNNDNNNNNNNDNNNNNNNNNNNDKKEESSQDLWNLLPVAVSSFSSFQQRRTNIHCSRQPEVSRSLQPLCFCRVLNQLDATNGHYNRHRTSGSQVTLFLPECGPMIFWECLLQNWLRFFFLYEPQRIRNLFLLLFYRTKQVAAVFLSHHSATLCFLVLYPEYLNIPRSLTMTFD